jgi:hypothetical protein
MDTAQITIHSVLLGFAVILLMYTWLSLVPSMMTSFTVTTNVSFYSIFILLIFLTDWNDERQTLYKQSSKPTKNGTIQKVLQNLLSIKINSTRNDSWIQEANTRQKDKQRFTKTYCRVVSTLWASIRLRWENRSNIKKWSNIFVD